MTKRVAKTSVFLMILVLSIVPIVSVTGMCDPIVPIPELCDVTITLPDEELGTIFAQDYAAGGASLVAITDVPGPGVQFDFSGLTTLWTSKVGVSDNFGRGGIDKLAGGSIDACLDTVTSVDSPNTDY
jgi:hypothetical protein